MLQQERLFTKIPSGYVRRKILRVKASSPALSGLSDGLSLASISAMTALISSGVRPTPRKCFRTVTTATLKSSSLNWSSTLIKPASPLLHFPKGRKRDPFCRIALFKLSSRHHRPTPRPGSQKSFSKVDEHRDQAKQLLRRRPCRVHHGGCRTFLDLVPRDCELVQFGGFPKLGYFFGIPIIRILVFWGLYWGPLILGNYHVHVLLRHLASFELWSKLGI